MPYSTRFYLGTATSEQTTVYTVPGTYIAVIRDVQYYVEGAAIDDVYLVAAESPGTPAAVIAAVGDLGPNAGTSWHGRVVLNGGDLLQLGAYGDTLFLTISGYLLSSP